MPPADALALSPRNIWVQATIASWNATDYRPFVNYDARYRLKFNSGTIQNEAIRLKGKTVKIKKCGWRIPLFPEYENVVKLKK